MPFISNASLTDQSPVVSLITGFLDSDFQSFGSLSVKASSMSGGAGISFQSVASTASCVVEVVVYVNGKEVMRQTVNAN